ncbi:MAG: hypothetical protein Aurels2KO_23990 [Aureliella sp.]
MKRGLKNALRLALLGTTGVAACAAIPGGQASRGDAEAARKQPAITIGKASFRIPFTIDSHGSRPSKVELWVSTDAGKSWQKHGSSAPDASGFDFKAAAQGEYLFLVQSVDVAGVAYPSNAPPMRVLVDTEKPKVTLEADLNDVGQLAIALQIDDPNLNPQTAQLRLRTNRDSDWQNIPTDQLAVVPGKPGKYRLKQLADIDSCREVALVFRIEDKAGNAGEATYKYEMPRTASLPDLTLASTDSDGSHLPAAQQSARRRFEPMPGATSWAPAKPATRQIAANAPAEGSDKKPRPGKLAGANQGLKLELPSDLEPNRTNERVGSSEIGAGASPYGGPALSSPGGFANSEELPLPPAEQPGAVGRPQLERPESATRSGQQRYTSTDARPQQEGMSAGATHPAESTPDSTHLSGGADRRQSARKTVDEPSQDLAQPPRSESSDVFQCNTRTFSLDYSVESLGGSSLSDVQLWGTEDGGAHWSMWGTDPDRVSPFDVKVGNDGMFGFRMVIVGTNGVVSNRPKFGDKPDVELEVDTEQPSAQITRAVYGKGTAEGQLVIDYSCKDSRLARNPVSLHYRTSKRNPWQPIESGLPASDTYLWQPPRDLPDQIYLKVEAVDRAGNVGSYELVDPIDIKGLAPRGRIHRVRPIR